MKKTIAALMIAGLMAGSLSGCIQTGSQTTAPAEDTASDQTEETTQEEESAEETPQLDEAAQNAAWDLLDQAVDMSLIENRLETSGNVAIRTMTYGEGASLSETIYLAAPDTYSAVSYTDGAVTYCEIMRDGETYLAATDESGEMKVVDLIFADEKDWKKRVVENHDLWSFSPMADEVVTACEETEEYTVITTELTDPETVEGILGENGGDAFIYRPDSRLVSTYTISADGYFTSAAMDYVLEDGTVIPFETTEFEADTPQRIEFPFEELNVGIDPGVTRKITLVFYPGTEDAFTTIKTLPQHMNLTPVLPGDTGYDIYTNESCTEIFGGSDGTVNLTLYIVPNAPLPVDEDVIVTYDDIEAAGAVEEEEARLFSTLLSQNLVSMLVSGDAGVGVQSAFTGSDGTQKTFLAGCAAERHWIELREGETIADACLFEDSTTTYTQTDDQGTFFIACDIFEDYDDWQAVLAENEDSLSVSLTEGEVLTSVETADDVTVAVTEITGEEALGQVAEAGIQASGLALTFEEGDFLRFTYTFDAESGAFISKTGSIVKEDGTETEVSRLTYEYDFDASAFVFPYTELDGGVNPEETRTFTMVLDPGRDENMTISRTVPKFVAILPVIARETYTIYADEACTEEYMDGADDLESDITIYIK